MPPKKIPEETKMIPLQIQVLCTAILLALIISMVLSRATLKAKFKAAVYEHEVVLPPSTLSPVSRTEALQHMQVNLNIYRTQTQNAKQQGADIVVFPENGLYGYIFTRATIRPYLEFIPDPESITWSACDDPSRFPNTDVQRQLSCMAKENSIYLVADMGDIQKCSPSTDSRCPSDGVFQYNTAVAFDPKGRLVAKYHKRNLYKESQFDRPDAQVKFFDTPFGRFGLMICFDILFKSPGIDMVTTHNISNVIFPTAWMDSLPLLSAIGWHSSFARGQKVNLLAANIHLPGIRVQGSGIYTPNGMASFYYNRAVNSGPKLIVQEIDVLGLKSSNQQVKNIKGEMDALETLKLDGNDISLTESRENFQNKGFTFVALKEESGSVNVCQNQVCCSLDYAFSRHPKDELIALGAFDGLFHKKYYSQICAVLECTRNDEGTCGSYTFVSGNSFAKAKLKASNMVQTGSVFPQAVVTDNGQLKLTSPKTWSWSAKDMTLTIDTPLKTPLLEMAIVTRDYSKDPHKQ